MSDSADRPDAGLGQTKPTMYGYTYEEWMSPGRLRERAQREWDEYQAMSSIFTRLQNVDHWKGPVSGWIEIEERDLAERAIIHFAGGGARFEEIDGALWVTAPGYWEMIGS